MLKQNFRFPLTGRLCYNGSLIPRAVFGETSVRHTNVAAEKCETYETEK